MASRVRFIVVACLAVLTLASASPAAENESPTTPRQGPAPGRGGVGGLIGASYFFAANEYSEGALPRFAFSGHFRYVFTPHLRFQVSPGFTWSAYSNQEPPPFPDSRFPDDRTKQDYLTLLTPVTAQLQLTMKTGPWHVHLGAGPGIYRVIVENHRKVVVDTVTFRLHRGVYPGGSAEIGIERFFKALPSTSFEFSSTAHYVFAEREEQFPVGWNSKLGAVDFKVGANYYFDLDRKKKTTELPLPPTGR